ncbi:MAG TPA: class I SAM-dependent methyltransferase [Candidatus Hydrogenedentes bacterium]|nr:class I SAM-dependent methyltransferase [Candidatus Hydrogenedentota bacterium]
MADDFKDHFSASADDYSLYRPDYPDSLFDHLSMIVPSTKQAWDCATGNGQAAIALANHFDQVIATDASEKQISKAASVENITYAVAPAENSGVQ